MKSFLILCFSFLIFDFAFSEHPLPFESKDNTIELSVRNTSAIAASGVKVVATNIPSWLHFSSTDYAINQLKAKGDTMASFSFSVDKLAPINKPQKLTFTITSSTGET